VALAALAVPATALAAGSDAPPPPTVGGVERNATPASNTGATNQSSGSSLPFTGADVIELTLFGAGAIGAGAFLVRRVHNRTT
jgi:hypothetical protein